jgi:O-antigen biosynthesis protein
VEAQERHDRSAPEATKEHLAAPGLATAVYPYSRQTKSTYKIPSPRPRVSVIMATTARPDIAEPSFTSLLGKTSYREFEFLVLINRSAWDAPERAALLKRIARYPQVHVIEGPGGSFNYSAVNNRGAEQASGEILCFLNDDTQVINADWLEILTSRVLLAGVAAVGPILYYPDGTIQHAGVILGLGGVAGHACLGEPRGSYGYFGRACIEQDVSCVSAACMVIRAEAFHAVGGFDEALPLAYNDVDLCLRLRTAGWRILWTPAAELMHRESASLGRHDEGTHAEQYRHDVAVIRKRWGSLLESDPFYNPNLSLERGFGLAFPPRHLKRK